MAEICVDCWNKGLEKPDKPSKFLRSWRPELCEECGQYKRVIIRVKMRYIVADRISEFFEDLRYLRQRRLQERQK